MREPDVLIDEYEGIWKRFKSGNISATEYFDKMTKIGKEYIRLLDSLPTPDVLEVPAR